MLPRHNGIPSMCAVPCFAAHPHIELIMHAKEHVNCSAVESGPFGRLDQGLLFVFCDLVTS